MPAIWTTPKDWKYKDVFSATDANIQIRDNLLWLYHKPSDFLKCTGSNIVAAMVVTWAAVDDTQFTRTIVTTSDNQEVDLTYEGNVQLATGAQYACFDWLMDAGTYVSTMTATPETYGSKMVYVLTAGIDYPAGFRKRVVVPTAGVHTFKLRGRIVTSNCNLTIRVAGTVVETGVQIV